MSATEGQVLPSVQRVAEATFLGITWAMTWVSFAFLVFRLTVRIRSFGKFQLDDYFVIAGWCMLLTSASIWQTKAYIIYWLYQIQEDPSTFTMDFIEAEATMMPQITTWNILFYSCLWSIKFSFLFFFRRLYPIAKAHKIWWWVVFSITLITWISSIADIDWGCSLNSIEWIQANCSSPKHVLYDNRTFYANMATDVLTDILIISIPVTLLRRVKIPLRKKIILFGVFSATIVIMIMSIVRVTLVKGTTTQLQSASIDWLYLWSNIEAGTAIMVACVGSFRQLFVSSSAKPAPQERQTKGPSISWLDKLFSRSRTQNNTSAYSDEPLEHQSNEGKWSSESPAQRAVPAESVHVNTTYEISHTPPINELPGNQIHHAQAHPKESHQRNQNEYMGDYGV